MNKITVTLSSTPGTRTSDGNWMTIGSNSSFTCSNVTSYTIVSGDATVTPIGDNTYKFAVSKSQYLGKDGSGTAWAWGSPNTSVVEITLG